MLEQQALEGLGHRGQYSKLDGVLMEQKIPGHITDTEWTQSDFRAVFSLSGQMLFQQAARISDRSKRRERNAAQENQDQSLGLDKVLNLQGKWRTRQDSNL
ncbi:hypothetical protein HG264_14150 [Pseudomonas sp. gcc21]|uniref:hypothetical protein n=1 Tax=Pseudomonas sp. gcc21 TaxID=2726989 RepID=UPI0014521962|nr:hypothetical protein [Pseudomonas sp. gcc21]QJD59960.1 hypothetical protein HG264_14150 [Pseudomonas sp. gcc21]